MADFLRVDVVPAQSAYFAGETFQVYITFVNTQRPLKQANGNEHAPGAGKQPLAGSLAQQDDERQHQKASSLSLPLSRNGFPESPLERFHQLQQESPASSTSTARNSVHTHPRTPLSASFASLPPEIQASIAASTGVHARKGLIGKNRQLHVSNQPNQYSANNNRWLYNARRIPQNHKRNNYSIAMLAGSSTPDLTDSSAQQAAMSYLHGQKSRDSSSTSTIRRSPSEVFAKDPPLSRQRSLQHLENAALSSSSSRRESDFEARSPLSPQDTPRMSTDFYNLGRNESMDSVLRDSMTDFAKRRPPLTRGSSSPVSTRSASRLPSATMPSAHHPSSDTTSESGRSDAQAQQTKDKFQHLLWAFAQLQGSFEVDETLIKPAEFVAVKQALFGSGGAGETSTASLPGIIGGGSLDTPVSSPTTWRSWLWNTSAGPITTANSASPSSHASRHRGNNHVPDDMSQSPSRSSTNQHRRVPSTATTAIAGGISGGGTLADRQSRAMSEKSVPILSVPPSVFAIDLALGPGESKTCLFFSLYKTCCIDF